MGNFVFNISKGRVAEFNHRIDNNDPANSVFELFAFVSTATDATLKDLDDVAAVAGDANTAEATNTGYSSKVLSDADTSALAADDTNDDMEVDVADQTFSAISAGDNWTDLLFGYDSDSTGGTDANILPCTWHDFVVTPDGSDITAQITGFFRATD